MVCHLEVQTNDKGDGRGVISAVKVQERDTIMLLCLVFLYPGIHKPIHLSIYNLARITNHLYSNLLIWLPEFCLEMDKVVILCESLIYFLLVQFLTCVCLISMSKSSCTFGLLTKSLTLRRGLYSQKETKARSSIGQIIGRPWVGPKSHRGLCRDNQIKSAPISRFYALI